MLPVPKEFAARFTERCSMLRCKRLYLSVLFKAITFPVFWICCFSDDLRRFQWGVQLGADWKAFKHLKVYADLNWGANEIFKKDFETISFDMYTVYLNVGFGYAF